MKTEPPSKYTDRLGKGVGIGGLWGYGDICDVVFISDF